MDAQSYAQKMRLCMRTVRDTTRADAASAAERCAFLANMFY